jgi:hypothetical protein
MVPKVPLLPPPPKAPNIPISRDDESGNFESFADIIVPDEPSVSERTVSTIDSKVSFKKKSKYGFNFSLRSKNS